MISLRGSRFSNFSSVEEALYIRWPNWGGANSISHHLMTPEYFSSGFMRVTNIVSWAYIICNERFPVNATRTHHLWPQGREMCTSRWLLSDIGWFYILFLSSSTYFYLICLHQHQTTNSRWSERQCVTLVLSFRLTMGICVYFELIWHLTRIHLVR